jgi:hypothetical protein
MPILFFVRPIHEDPLASRTQHRASGARWDLLARRDGKAALILVVAAFLSLLAAFQGPAPDQSVAYFVVSPISAGLYGLGLLAMFLEEDRHGLVRGLSGAGAILQVLTAIAVRGNAPATGIFLFYWVPAALSVIAAITLARSRTAARVRI